jgi:PKD repeat protein
VIARVNFQCSNLILYDTLDINIGGASSAAFSIPSPVCAGQPASFTYTGGAAGTGAWTFGSGTPNSASGLGTQTSTWASPGTYPVTLNVTPSNGACLPASLTQNVIVSAPPTSTFTFPASLCLNANGTLTYSGSAPAGSTYSWNFGADASPATAATAGPQTVSWSTAGSKTVSLTVTSGTCSSTTTNTITVNAAPTSAFTVNPSPVCAMANTAVTFTGTAAAGSTYTWNFGLGASPLTASGVGPHTVSWGSNGSKTVGLTVTTSGCSATSSQTVVVNPIPNSPFVLPASVCVGANASITYAGSASAPPGATYNWNVGGGLPAPGNVQGPFSVNWATAGTKTLTLSVTESGCTSSTTTHNITVNPNPTVAIAATPSSVCTGQSTSLAITGTAPASGSTYSWNFGATASPITSSSAGPVNVSWNTAGTFAPSLTVTTNGCSSAPASATVTVSSPPTAAITVPASGCVGVPVAVLAAGTYPSGSTFNWNFGSGTVLSGSGAGPYSVQWAAGGNQSVSFTVTSGSCTANASSVINIRSGPTASFTAPASLCANQNGTITFTGSAAAGATYAWDFGANATPATASTVGPHSVSWSSPGSKTVSLTITDGGCAPVTVTQTVVINPGYTATFSMPANVCQNGSGAVTYTGNAPVGSTYSWNFGTGATPATANSVGPHNVSWSTIGTSTVTLSVTTAGCVAGPVSQSIVVSGPPTSTFNLPNSICASTPLQISYTGNASAGATFNWSFPGGTPASATGIGPHTYSWANAGVYNVSLSVVQNGCTSSTTTNSIQVFDAPTNTFSLPLSACIGQSVSATYAGNATAGATYAWDFGPNATPSTATTLGPHSVTWSTSGVKTASLVVTQCAGCY